MPFIEYDDIKKYKIPVKSIEEPAFALGGYSYWYCPRCKRILDCEETKCSNCGQKIIYGITDVKEINKQEEINKQKKII